MRIRNRILIVALCLAASATMAVYNQAQSAGDLASTTNAFLVSLSTEQAGKAKFDFTSEERTNFHYTPVARQGLPVKEMEPHQRDLVHAMVSAALSRQGAIKASTIMSLEQVLAVLEGSRPNARIQRDPEMYFVSIFGTPAASGKWGWRFEGHHLSVNLTMESGNYVASAPTFFGSNPAEVREGPRQGLRVLALEEDLARKMMASLTADQKRTATMQKNWESNDMLSAEKLKFDLGSPMGIAGSRLNATQKQNLVALIGEYVGRVAPEAAARTMNEIRGNNGLDNVYFAWSGTETRNEPHYYRVHAPGFLIEYENSQNNANHIHSVFRDLKNEFGLMDSLRAHLIRDHGIVADAGHE